MPNSTGNLIFIISSIFENLHKKITRNPEQILWMLFSVFLTILFFSRFSVNFDQDEIEAVHTSWKIWQGGEPFRDFFQHHHLLLHYLLTPLFFVFGESFAVLQAARALIFFNFLGICAITYALGKKIFSHLSALAGTILYATMWLVFKSLEIRPDNPQVLFGLSALLFMYSYFDNQKISYLVLSALSFSIAFLFLQKAIFLGAFIGCYFLYQVYRKKMSFTHVIIFSFIAALPFFFYCVYLQSVGAFDAYIKFNWLINILHPGKFGSHYALSRIGMYERLLCAFYVLGLCYFSVTPYQKSIAIASLWLLIVASCIVKFAYFQYYIPVFPLIGLIAGHAVYKIFKKKRSMLVLFLSIVMIGPMIEATVNIAKFFLRTNKRQEKMKYVLNVTQSGDYVYDGKSYFNLFRPDIDFFWFEARTNHSKLDLITLLKKLTGRTYDCYAALEHYRPKLISNYYLDMNHPFIKNNYIQSPVYDDLYLYQK